MSIEWNVNDRVANNVAPDEEPTLALQKLSEMEMLSVAIGESIAAHVEQLKEFNEGSGSGKMESKNQSQSVDRQQNAPCSDIAEQRETKEGNDNVSLDDNNNDEAKDKTDYTEILSNNAVIKIQYRSEVENVKEFDAGKHEKIQNNGCAAISTKDDIESKVDDARAATASSVDLKVTRKNEKTDGYFNQPSAMERGGVQRKQQEHLKRQTFPVNYKASTSKNTYSTNKNLNYIESRNKSVSNTEDDRTRNYSVQRAEPKMFSAKPLRKTEEHRSHRRHPCYFSEETSRPVNNKKSNMHGKLWDPQKRNPSRKSYDAPSVSNSNVEQSYQGRTKRETAVYRRSVKFNECNYPIANQKNVERLLPPKRNHGANYSYSANSGPAFKNRSPIKVANDKTNSMIAHQYENSSTKSAGMPVYTDSNIDHGNEPAKLTSKQINENYGDKSQRAISDDQITSSMNSLQITDTKPLIGFDAKTTNNNDVYVKGNQTQFGASPASNMHIDYRNASPESNTPEHVNTIPNYSTQPDEAMQQMNISYTAPAVNAHQGMKETSENMVPSVYQNNAQSSVKPLPSFYNHSVPRNRWNYATQGMMYPGPAMTFPNYLPSQLFYMPYACGPNCNPHLAYHPSMVQQPQFNAYPHRNDYVNKSRNPAHMQGVDNYQHQPETKHPNYSYHMPYDTFGCGYKSEYNNPRTGFPTKPEPYHRAMSLNENQKYSPYPYVTAMDTNFVNQSIYNQNAVCDYKHVAEVQSHPIAEGEADFNQYKSANDHEVSIPPLISPKDCMTYENFVPNSQARLNLSYPYRNPNDGQVPQMGTGRGRLRLTNQ